MTRESIAPERIGDGMEYTERHPAFGTIGASRVSSTPGAYLFGSDFRHQGYVVVRIGAAELRRDLARDWIGGGRRQYIEVALSEAQWASFVSRPNIGEGIPCTVQFLADSGPVPAISRTSDRRAQLRGEIETHLADALAQLDQVARIVRTLNVSARARHEILDGLTRIRADLAGNLEFVASSFDEHAEQTIERARIEVGAIVQDALTRAGLDAVAGPALLAIGDGA